MAPSQASRAAQTLAACCGRPKFEAGPRDMRMNGKKLQATSCRCAIIRISISLIGGCQSSQVSRWRLGRLGRLGRRWRHRRPEQTALTRQQERVIELNRMLTFQRPLCCACPLTFRPGASTWPVRRLTQLAAPARPRALGLAAGAFSQNPRAPANFRSANANYWL